MWVNCGVASFVVLLSIATWFGPESDPLKGHPSMVLLLAAGSAVIGVIVQHRFTSRVGKGIFGAPTNEWQRKAALNRTYARESNITLCLIVLLSMGYPLTLFFATRSTQTIIDACKSSLDAQLYARGKDDGVPSIALPVCQCLSKVFLNKNGVVRLALFDTPLMAPEDFNRVTEFDEARCVDSVIQSTPDLASRPDVPVLQVPFLDQ
jgi:hypothetical protein